MPKRELLAVASSSQTQQPSNAPMTYSMVDAIDSMTAAFEASTAPGSSNLTKVVCKVPVPALAVHDPAD